MFNEIYQKSEIITCQPGSVYFWSLKNEDKALVVLLKEFKDSSRLLKIKFVGILGYRVIQEAGRLQTINEHEFSNVLYTAKESSFLSEFLEESGGIFDDFELIHYIICNSDNIIDVISGPPVTVEWLVA